MTRSDGSIGIYFHVPFCASKCPYCDFYSHCDPALLPAYADAVIREAHTLSGCRDFTDADVFDRRIESVYFGGGTPSLLSIAQIGGMLSAVSNRFSLAPDAEITLEVNPSLQDKQAFFDGAAAAGVNRVSIGLQSAVDTERRALGRRSGAEAAADCVKAAKNAGVTDVSLDLMIGIPHQTRQTLLESLDFALSLDITHLSAYILKTEPGTVFYKRRETLGLPDDDTLADYYLLMCEHLKNRGMRHYEISNFCFDGRVGRHNMRYWQNGAYLGFGPSAHSYYNGRRFFYADDLQAFLDGKPCTDEGAGGTAEEIMMLSLRTDAGLDLRDFARQFDLQLQDGFTKQLSRLQTGGLLAYCDGVIRLTDRGMLLSNAVIVSLQSALFNE